MFEILGPRQLRWCQHYVQVDDLLRDLFWNKEECVISLISHARLFTFHKRNILFKDQWKCPNLNKILTKSEQKNGHFECILINYQKWLTIAISILFTIHVCGYLECKFTELKNYMAPKLFWIAEHVHSYCKCVCVRERERDITKNPIKT